MILPGAWLGVLGGGQLGRFFTLAARGMGYAVCVYDPDAQSPAGAVADRHICAPFDDTAHLREFARAVAAVTVEFENVPATTLAVLAQETLVRPAPAAVAIAQDRRAEKSFFKAQGLPVGAFCDVRTAADFAQARNLRFPAILKIARLGYDGKGQATVNGHADLPAAFERLGGVPCVLEERLALATEISLVLARGDDGAVAPFPLAENRHRHGILDLSIVPARIDDAVRAQAVAFATTIARALDYVGVLGVEFFVLDDGRLVLNEMAPRPHNSGHYTIDACATDQFEQQVRALCGLPLGDARLLAPAVMVNLLGDVWREDRLPAEAIVAPRVKLHLYGKREPRPGRKMGHFTVLADSAEAALEEAVAIQARLARGSERAMGKAPG